MKSRWIKKEQLKITNLSRLFCLLSFVCLGITLIIIFFSHGTYFSKLFFHDSLDTGMDFFHSIEYTNGRMPYEKFHTLYPPLANFLFYILFRFVPLEQSNQWSNTFIDGINARGTITDLRIWQPTLLLFIIFITITTICLFLLIQKSQIGNSLSSVIALCCIFSYGTLYSYERGNIIILSLLGTLFFVLYRKHSKRWVRELALISLAFSAGIKLYPAIFGFLLLYDKQYKSALRSVVYGVLFFILPSLVFHGGLSNIPLFWEQLKTFMGQGNSYPENYSFSNMIDTISIILSLTFETNWRLGDWPMVSQGLNLFAMLFILFSGFYAPKNWQKILCCSTAMLIYNSQGAYGMIFFQIPLLALIFEEKNIIKANALPYIALVGTQLLLPIFSNDSFLISPMSIRFQICMALIFIYVILSLKNWRVYNKNNKDNESCDLYRSAAIRRS